MMIRNSSLLFGPPCRHYSCYYYIISLLHDITLDITWNHDWLLFARAPLFLLLLLCLAHYNVLFLLLRRRAHGT